MARTVITHRKPSDSQTAPAGGDNSPPGGITPEVDESGAAHHAATNSTTTTSSHTYSSTTSDTGRALSTPTNEPAASASHSVPAGGERQNKGITQSFSAGIMACLRVHNSASPIECPWNPRKINSARVTEIVNDLKSQEQFIVTALEGPVYLLVITTMTTTTNGSNERVLQPVDVVTQGNSTRHHYQAVPLTTDVLLNAIAWVTGKDLDSSNTLSLQDLLPIYLKHLENKLAWKQEETIQMYNTKLRSFISDHGWNSSAEEKEQLKLLTEAAPMHKRLRFIYRHLAHQTKVVAHVVNGQHRLLALDRMLNTTSAVDTLNHCQQFQHIHQHEISGIFFLPQKLDGNFATAIQIISLDHQTNSSKMIPHTVLHLLNHVMEDMNRKKLPWLKAGLESVYQDMKESMNESMNESAFKNAYLELEKKILALMTGVGMDEQKAKASRERYLSPYGNNLCLFDLVKVYINVWIGITAECVWEALRVFQAPFRTIVGFSLPPKSVDFATYFQKNANNPRDLNKFTLMPIDQLKTVMIRADDDVFKNPSYGTELANKRPVYGFHRRNAVYQILIWSRLSESSNKDIRTMIDFLSKQAQLCQETADTMLWNFHHSVVDSVKISFPIWEQAIPQTGKYLLCGSPPEVVKFCLLVSAVNRNTGAIKKHYTEPSEHLVKFLQEKPKREFFAKDYENISDSLWKTIENFYKNFFNDELTFITTAYCFYMQSVGLQPEGRKAREARKVLENFNFPLPPYEYNPFNETNHLCPFGNTDDQLACVGKPLSDFPVEVVFPFICQFVMEVARRKHNKQLAPYKKQPPDPTPTSTTMLAEIDQGQDEAGGKMVGPVESESEASGQVEAVGEASGPPLQEVVVETEFAASHGQHWDEHSTPIPQPANEEESAEQSTSSGQISKPKRKRKPEEKPQQVKERNKKPKVTIHLSSDTGLAIDKALTLAHDYLYTSVENYKHYCNDQGNTHDFLQVMKEYQQKVERVRQLFDKKKPIRKVGGNNLPARVPNSGWNLESAVRTEILAVQQTDDQYDQDRALHQTEKAGIGADSMSSESDQFDDTHVPYKDIPFLDQEAKETSQEKESDHSDLDEFDKFYERTINNSNFALDDLIRCSETGVGSDQNQTAQQNQSGVTDPEIVGQSLVGENQISNLPDQNQMAELELDTTDHVGVSVQDSAGSAII